jgi:hypothetical protein
METDYPEHLLAREPAPPYGGEGPFALWHFSEDPALSRFLPRVPATNPAARPLVWAVDTRHAPMFWFPRDCPRGCIWPSSATAPEDRERFFGQSAAMRIHVMEGGWLGRMRDCRLYGYQLPARPFRPHEVGGYWVCDEPVAAVGMEVVDDLIGRHERAGIELRITPSIWPFWRRVAASTVAFSGSRLRNAGPHPDRLPEVAAGENVEERHERDEAEDRPGKLGAGAHVPADRKVDPHQDDRDGVQETHEQLE